MVGRQRRLFIFGTQCSAEHYAQPWGDSKLTSKSPWTDNQATELIDIFKRKTPPPPTYIEFEVRTLNSKLPADLQIGGSKIRIYRSDVYKTVSNGSGNFGQTIKMF